MKQTDIDYEPFKWRLKTFCSGVEIVTHCN